MRKMCLISVLVMMALLAGCQESQKQEVWGQGETPAHWQGFFGNDNNARLNFVQSQVINKQAEAITELSGRIRMLEAENPAELAERVRKLEIVGCVDPNGEKPNGPE